MKREIVIEQYGLGNAVVILECKKIIDLFIDPPSDANFYPPNTFVKAIVQRRISKRGGYFIKLPNSFQGFLKSQKNYKEGEVIVLLSKVFFDKEKPQTFTDKLKITSKYFILKFDGSGFSFSKKISKNFKKEKIIPILEERINDNENIFIICRSKVAELSVEQFIRELERMLQQYKSINEKLLLRKIDYAALAKKLAFNKYDVEGYCVIEGEGIFERLGLWDQIDLLCQKKYTIRNGPNLILEQTSSFFVIDVNSGKDLKIEARELNFLASGEICRLIKILGIGGKIIIDFLPCSRSTQREIFDFFVDFFFDDNSRNKIWGWTDGGVFELERERDKSPLELLVSFN